MKIKFCGAARQVTGSMHLVELQDGYRVLIDCGLDYEQQRGFHKNPEVKFPFDPKSIDLLILTHAHVDHSGNIPTLINQGFEGNVLCTPPTAELSSYLLIDSLKIMQAEANKKQQGKKGQKHGRGKSLYGFRDVDEAQERMVTVDFHKPFEVNDYLRITFREAGHILGAASVLLEIKEGSRTIRVGFTGDLGNFNSKLMKDPLPFEDIDYLITESTYGGRFHIEKRSAEDVLLQMVEDTCVKQPGRLVIPAFSVGRTQAIVYTLHELYRKGLLPDIKFFVDSPLAIKTTHIYSKYREYLNDETNAFARKNGSLFEFEGIHYAMDRKSAEMIDDHYEPCVIISAAGMVEGGRIQEHVRNNIRNAYCTILIAGFCAPGTLGERLLSGQGYIHMHGKELAVFAQVDQTDVFSAHPDQVGLKKYIEDSGGKSLKRIFLVHGEESSMLKLQESMEVDGYENVTVPEKLEEFEII